MKFIPAFLLLGAAITLTGCLQVSTSKTEQRVVELPADNPEATLKAAVALVDVVKLPLSDEVEKKFPKVSKQQLLGVFAVAHERLFEGKKTVYIETGIQYVNTQPEAAAIADFCQSRVQATVDHYFAKSKAARSDHAK